MDDQPFLDKTFILIRIYTKDSIKNIYSMRQELKV